MLFAKTLRVRRIVSYRVERFLSAGEYSGLEHETVPGVVESLKIVTRKNIERIARFAFNYASTHDRKKVGSRRERRVRKRFICR